MDLFKQSVMLYLESIGSKRFRMRSFLRFGVDVMFEDNHDPEKIILARRMFKRAVFVTVYSFSSFLLITIGPLYYWSYKNVYVIPTGVILPFVDSTTFEGFLINYCIQNCIVFVGLLCLLAIEVSLVLVDSLIYAMTKLAIKHMQDYNDNICHGIHNLKDLTEIIKKLEDIKAFVELVNECYYWKFLLQPPWTTYCTAIALFCQHEVRSLFFLFP